MKVEWVIGNLLDAPDAYICHQCNMLSPYAAGLAKQIFDKYPFSDIYTSREKWKNDPRHALGRNIVLGDVKNDKWIVNMMAQNYPGQPFKVDGEQDGFTAREKYFQNCLDELLEQLNAEYALFKLPISVAFPYMIGCGLAGGSWDNYLKMIEGFAERLFSGTVRIYKLEH